MPRPTTGAKPRPPLAPRISHFTITKDGAPTRLAEPLPFAPFGILGEVAIECEPGDEPMRLKPAEGLYSRTTGIRSAFRRALRISFNTTRVIEALAQSIHYDCSLAKQIGKHGKFEIVTVYAERTCRECGCSSRRRSAKTGPKGKPNAYWIEEDLCSACAEVAAARPKNLMSAFAPRTSAR